MWEGIIQFLSSDRYVPPGYRHLGQTPLVWLHGTDDLLIALAYFSLLLLLLYFVRRRENVPVKGVFFLCGAFLFSCGTIHLFSVWTLWYPVYWLSGTLKALTALLSAYTAVVLYPLLPRVLARPFPVRFASVNSEASDQIRGRKIGGGNPELEPRGTMREIAEREKTESRLQEVNARLTERVHELETRVEEMIRLGEIGDFLQTRLTVAEVENALGDRLSRLFSGSSGAIFRTGGARQPWESVVYWGKITDRSNFPSHPGWALCHASDRREEADSPDPCGQPLDRENGVTSLCLPMMARGETIGVLYLDFDDPLDLTPGKRRLAETAAKQIAIGLANLQLLESLQRLSYSDTLTGLYNRRYLETTLARELHRFAREGGSIGLILLDIDYFKRINDSFGHETGDRVLRAIGDYLRANTRQSDIACRYGGEEFVLVLLDSSLEDTRERAEALCRGLRELELTREQPELSPISASIGVSAFPVHGQTSAELFRVADEGLYQAKNQGRDRVCCAA